MDHETPEPAEQEQAPEEPENLGQEQDDTENVKTFDEPYVKNLREEAKKHRQGRKDAESKLETVKDAFSRFSLGLYTHKHLSDTVTIDEVAQYVTPSDYIDDSGTIDTDGLDKAVKELAKSKPHLAQQVRMPRSTPVENLRSGSTTPAPPSDWSKILGENSSRF